MDRRGGEDVQGLRRALCPQCSGILPPEVLACPSCGADHDGETVLDDARRSDAATSHSDTAPNGKPVVSRAAAALASFAERADEELERLTSVVFHSRHAEVPTPSAGSSSDPPTKFLRGVDQHIELPAGSFVDEYEIDGKLGAGAMGVVYSARHVQLGRRVAIKVIAPSMGADPQALARFEREARALASLHHPNIVDVYAFGTLPDERSYFVMEHLSGEALDERLARGRVSLDEALKILDQMARALEAAHAQGIVHRDLKPSNTFLQQLPGEPPLVKIVDFGLAKWAADFDSRADRTQSGVAIGTPMYMSPEQARGPNVDGRTDIYALGVVAYELVLGRHPFPEARTPTAALAAHLMELPPQPRTIWPGIPAALDLLMHSMLAKDANGRPTLAHVRNVIASMQSSTATAGRAIRAATELVASPTGAPQPRSLMSVARSRSPTPEAQVPVDETRASRRVFVALAGLIVLGAIIIATAVGSGGASVGKPGRVIEEPRSAIEIDASVPPTATAAPSVALDASVSVAMPVLRVDAGIVTPRSKIDSVSPSIARPVDGGAQESEPTVVVEPDLKPVAIDTATIDASVEPDDGDASIEVDVSIKPTTTSPPSRRTPPVPTAKKPPNRHVIVNPFRKKQITK